MLLLSQPIYSNTPQGTVYDFFPIRDLCAVITSYLIGLGVGAMFLGILAGIVDMFWLLSSLNENTSSIKFWTNEKDFLANTGFATHFLRPLGKTTLYLFAPCLFPFMTVACFLPVLELWSITANWVLATIPLYEKC